MRAFAGSLALARGNLDGLRAFDTSIEGFWRSFGAVVLVAPIYLVAVTLELSLTARDGAAAPAADLAFYLSRLATLCVDWIAWPIVMVFLARLLGLGERYAGYIVVYNWSSVLIILVLLPPALLYSIGLIPASIAIALNLAVTLWALYFRYYVARHALSTTVGTAVGLVVIDFLLSLMINLASNDLYVSAPPVPGA